jgi:hypothetical protein
MPFPLLRSAPTLPFRLPRSALYLHLRLPLPRASPQVLYLRAFPAIAPLVYSKEDVQP